VQEAAADVVKTFEFVSLAIQLYVYIELYVLIDRWSVTFVVVRAIDKQPATLLSAKQSEAVEGWMDGRREGGNAFG
jgi:hypothetical protein